MKKSQADQTTAKNLEDKFDRGDDVLDYFDARKARVIVPPFEASAAKAKSAYPVKRNSKRTAIVRERSTRYRKKKQATIGGAVAPKAFGAVLSGNCDRQTNQESRIPGKINLR
jgi:hypothetical protein